MNFPSLKMALIAGLVLPFGLATASLAQDAPPPAPPAGDAADMHHHRDPAEMRAHMAEHLRAALQLQPGQDAALNAFIESMKPAGMDHHGMHRQPGEAQQRLTTPERLDKMLARADARHTQMIAHVAAVKQFYAQLSPSQQQAFDAMAPMMGHRHEGGEHGGHHDGGHDQMGPGGPPQG
jgi:periplasmic protein CpxP/Spy